ncbi:hypothetical protein Q5424_27095 [Conexibacter sp. JD483]|uniref:hypothetical protein n=1 Tax=unclassified Conexibacter TaxID=2627773 RepID=UPI00271CE636|nr:MULTISPECIES: hypothetical protein [unclassified Conexibacter]MDO8188310.1 hypothetical protein [Conexibacter sp. CPCC 205706]MDO8198990.1 hypothetical protein [Conexibacter sp. CPCC 205762]MDR9372797.1 hypothetical protein [Conexibacter sp. JD483]
MIAALFALLAAAAVAVRRRARRARSWPARSKIVSAADNTTLDDRGAVRSTQAADLTLSEDELEKLWSPAQLERLAATYWRFLTRVTLGLIRIDYSETQRTVVLVRAPLRLLRFGAPEYEMDGERGIVRWRIEDGLLVARAGRHGDGYLQIDVRRCPSSEPGSGLLHVEVEVANFYPWIATSVSRRVYRWTQSAIHVLVTHGFLRSLARLDLAESKVGRFAPERVEDVPDPAPASGGSNQP